MWTLRVSCCWLWLQRDALQRIRDSSNHCLPGAKAAEGQALQSYLEDTRHSESHKHMSTRASTCMHMWILQVARVRRKHRAASLRSRDIQREADRYRQPSHGACWIISSTQIILYATFLYTVDPWAAIVEKILKRAIPTFISQAAAGYQKIRKRYSKNNIYLHNKAWLDFHFGLRKLLEMC